MDIDMSLLDDEEQALLETLLGKLQIEKKKIVRLDSEIKVKTKLKPYNLKVVYTCTTCGAITEAVYKMQVSHDESALVSSLSLDKNIEVHATNNRSCKVCCFCREFLEQKSKSELITMYLQKISAH